MPAARSYVAGNFQLVLDGVDCGFLKSVDGGAPVAEVITESVGSSYFAKKHIGQVEYGPFAVQFGLSMNKALYEWINASWTGNYMRKNGAVVAADHQLDAVSQREFFDALLTETTFPTLDGSSKNPAYLTLRFAPEYTRNRKASGKVTSPAKGAQKLWLPSNFRVAIDGLDCTRISVVDSFTVKQSVAVDDIGISRDYLREPTKLEFPNLKITMMESSARSWLDWFEDFVIKGNNDESKEKNGSITLLSANMADELLRVDLFNLGIFKIGNDKVEANSDRITTVTAHLYCERMELHAGGAPKAITAPRTRGARKAKSRRRR